MAAFKVAGLELTNCIHCKAISIWYLGKMVYPETNIVPLPNSDLPADIKSDYEEAAKIIQKSPRSASALMRLCIQKLTNNILGITGDSNLNDNIKRLVENGLPEKIQKALDIVRVTGNNAVHPGLIDLRDDVTTAAKLFDLVNIITDYMITNPKKISDLFDQLPAKDREKIAKRDRQK